MWHYVYVGVHAEHTQTHMPGWFCGEQVDSSRWLDPTQSERSLARLTSAYVVSVPIWGGDVESDTQTVYHLRWVASAIGGDRVSCTGSEVREV